MAKATDSPLAQTARLLDLVPFITSHQGISISDLAHQFAINEKQLISDLTTLWMCGLPGYTALELMDLSFDSGYVYIRNAETLCAPRALTKEEIIALLLGLDLVDESLPSQRIDLANECAALRARLVIALGVRTPIKVIPSGDGRIRATLLTASSQKRLVRVEYHSFYKDEISTREILPLEFRVESDHEYIYAFCITVNAFRNFRVDRVMNAVFSEKTVLERAPSLGASEISPKATIRATKRLRTISERFGLQISLGEEVPIAVYTNQWLIRSILASAGDVEVLTPTALRAEIRSSAAETLALYR